ncbi:uncharacterized protein LJ206_017641 isoform 4-T4 [Theristicus caerulescens]
MAKGAGVETVRSCPDLCKTVTISHVLPALIRPLMSQAPLIADFTRFRPIVDLHRRGFDSSGQAPGRGGAGGSRREGGREEGKKKGGGGEEGVGSIGSKKTCQQNKILTNDREKCSKSHPRLLSAYRVSPGCAAAGERPPPVRGQRGATSAERGAARSRGAGGRRQRAPAGLGGGGGPGGWSGRGSSAAAVLRQILESGSRWGAPRPPLRAPPRKAAQRRRGGRRRAAGGGPAARPRVATSSAALRWDQFISAEKTTLLHRKGAGVCPRLGRPVRIPARRAKCKARDAAVAICLPSFKSHLKNSAS